MLVFDAAVHAYTLDGRPVPSVTGILKAQGLIRLDHIPSHILERARRRGSDVHALIHYYNDGDLDPASIDPIYQPYVDAWVSFLTVRKVRVVASEYRIASRIYAVAGTFDVLGQMDGIGALIDVKTGDPDDVAADLQTAAYLGLAFQWAETDDHLAAALARFAHIRRHAVRLRPDGRYEIETYDNPRDYHDFLTLAAAWHVRMNRGVDVAVSEVL
jgi:hypothetical protein